MLVHCHQHTQSVRIYLFDDDGVGRTIAGEEFKALKTADFGRAFACF